MKITREVGGRFFLFSLVIVLLGGCAGPRTHVKADAIPRDEPFHQHANPESYVVLGKRYFVMQSNNGYAERGIASWYGKQFHGNRTSTGERYDMYEMTAAHKTLRIPSYVRVTNLKNGRSVVVRVNDRGPFHQNRIIDLSYAAAEKLDMTREGTALVEVRVVNAGPAKNAARTPPVAVSAPEKDWRDQSHLHNRIFVQVGAFASRKNAEQLFDRLLQGRFRDVQIVSTEDPNRILHRVRIGPLSNVTATDEIVARLEGLGYMEYQIVIE